MRKDLDLQLVKDFPLLYADRNGSAQETCMCWGFSCGDGWEPLIRELSAKLEPMIEKYIEENQPLMCDNCCCAKSEHNDDGQCTHWEWKPFALKIGYRESNKIKGVKSTVNKMLSFLYNNFNIRKKAHCSCKGYNPSYPKAAQVKEKFGGLRFYMTWNTKEMDDAVTEAEEKSEKICETCGNPGETRAGGWIRTLCDNHAKDAHGNILMSLKDLSV